MKKFITLLFLIGAFTFVHAQVRSVNLQITLLSPIEYDFIQTDKPMDISVRIVNLGPNIMTEKDTLLFTVRYDGDTVYSASKPLYKAFYYLPSGIAVNQTVTQVLWAGLTQNYNNGGVHIYCLDAKLLNRNPTTGCNDPDYTNNSGCHHVYTTIWANGIDPKNEPGKIKSNFEIFPVPCTGTASLSYTLNENSNVSITLTDMQGRTVKNVSDEFMNAGSYIKDIDVSSLSQGIYIACINVNGRMYTSKFIKQ